ncbi:hypothetical protein DAT35_51615 [Vitiosangium sp. GDMCC 1.1324]|nr:hypothetical protein DAT35_51615 [Vitiosangium sp. GDMCC 1.1324]
MLKHIRVRQSRFQAHPLFDELRPDRPLGEMLAFAPRLSFWVMCFQDVLRLNAQRVKDPELARLMRRHRAEERGHDHWFFEDLALLTGRSLTLDEPWDLAHECTRDASYALLAEVLRPMDDRLRVVLVLALESTSHTFFSRVSSVTQALGAGKRLKYFSGHHMEAEEQHEVFEAQMEAMLNGIELSPALRAEALGLVDRVYAAFHSMFDGLCAGPGAHLAAVSGRAMLSTHA